MKRALVIAASAIMVILFLDPLSVYGQGGKDAGIQPPAADVASVLTKLMDLDNDGLVSRTELRKFFTYADQDKNGYVAREEIVELVNKLYQETGPKMEQVAPDFSLRSIHGSATVKLSDFRDKKPVVLVFRDHTSPTFRLQSTILELLYQQYKTKAEWYLVCIRKPKPADGGNEINQTTTMEELISAARARYPDLGISIPGLIDDPDSKVGKAYAAWPERLYIVNKKGKIAYKSESGARDFKATEFMQKLKKICDT